MSGGTGGGSVSSVPLPDGLDGPLRQVLEHAVARGHQLLPSTEREDRLQLVPLGPVEVVVAWVDTTRSWIEFGTGAWTLVRLLELEGLWSRGASDTAGAKVTTARMAAEAMLLFDAYGKDRLQRR